MAPNLTTSQLAGTRLLPPRPARLPATSAPPTPRRATLPPQAVASLNGNGAAPAAATPQLAPDYLVQGTIGMPWTDLTPPPPLSDEVKAIIEEQSIDFETSGLKYLSNEARLKALDKKANKFEKTKVAKDGSRMWTEVRELAALIREGKTNWEDLDLDDVDVRLKWSGLFHRRKRTPGQFMMRLKVPNGELNADQLRFLGDCIAKYGPAGCADITTRANLQLRGVRLEDADAIMDGLVARGLSSLQSGMDNVRNMTGSPIAGIDPHEVVDVRPLNYAINDMITRCGLGNPELCNLPRKINIALSPSRDDFPHTHINDVGLKAIRHPQTGEVGFNVEVGGYFSIKRNAVSMSGNTYLTYDQVVPYCKAVLEVFRDHGNRTDRQKARLMWLVEEWGVDKFREEVGKRMGVQLQTEVHVAYDDVWPRRDVTGVHPQKQEGLFWVGAVVPVGRLQAADLHDMAHVAERYGDGTVRLTVEENFLVPSVPKSLLPAIKQEPIFQRFKIDAGNLMRGLVSCTGAQFCGIAIIETKNRAHALIEKLEDQLDIPQPVRIHWTGCPNSCGQAQVADIGLMGGPAKKDGKAVEGVRLFLGGTIGEGAELATEFEKGIPVDEEDLLPKLRNILVEKFGATFKAGVLAANA